LYGEAKAFKFTNVVITLRLTDIEYIHDRESYIVNLKF